MYDDATPTQPARGTDFRESPDISRIRYEQRAVSRWPAISQAYNVVTRATSAARTNEGRRRRGGIAAGEPNTGGLLHLREPDFCSWAFA